MSQEAIVEFDSTEKPILLELLEYAVQGNREMVDLILDKPTQYTPAIRDELKEELREVAADPRVVFSEGDWEAYVARIEEKIPRDEWVGTPTRPTAWSKEYNTASKAMTDIRTRRSAPRVESLALRSLVPEVVNRINNSIKNKGEPQRTLVEIVYDCRSMKMESHP